MFSGFPSVSDGVYSVWEQLLCVFAAITHLSTHNTQAGQQPVARFLEYPLGSNQSHIISLVSKTGQNNQQQLLSYGSPSAQYSPPTSPHLPSLLPPSSFFTCHPGVFLSSFSSCSHPPHSTSYLPIHLLLLLLPQLSREQGLFSISVLM